MTSAWRGGFPLETSAPAIYVFPGLMKIASVRRLLLVFAFIATSAYADFSATVDAGRLKAFAGEPMPHVDNVVPFSNGSLLLLVAANGDGTFSAAVEAGNFVAGNDVLLAAGGFNNGGGTDETITFFSVPTGGLYLPVDDRIALRWFPDITYAQYLAGTKPSAGQRFGTYNPRTSIPSNTSDNPDGGDPWLLPAGGSVELNFFTVDSDRGGTQHEIEGYANSAVSASPTPTPTPSATPTPTVSPTPTATPSVTPTPSPSASPTPTVSGDALLNISTRARAETGDHVLIGGFILGDGATKTIVVRAIGPSLGARGVNSPLLDPSLQLFNASGQLIASNDDWMTNDNQQAIADSGLAPTDTRESALLVELAPGAYTAIVTGVDGTVNNIALVEVYDLDSLSTPQLQNISTRGTVSTDESVMIAGVIVGGTTGQVAIIRGIGPSLANTVPDALPNPQLSLINSSGTVVAMNDDWQDTQASDIGATGLAPTNTLESAILAPLVPGAYTATLSDVSGTTGIGLIEVYNISDGF